MTRSIKNYAGAKFVSEKNLRVEEDVERDESLCAKDDVMSLGRVKAPWKALAATWRRENIAIAGSGYRDAVVLTIAAAACGQAGGR